MYLLYLPLISSMRLWSNVAFLQLLLRPEVGRKYQGSRALKLLFRMSSHDHSVNIFATNSTKRMRRNLKLEQFRRNVFLKQSISLLFDFVTSFQTNSSIRVFVILCMLVFMIILILSVVFYSYIVNAQVQQFTLCLFVPLLPG